MAVLLLLLLALMAPAAAAAPDGKIAPLRDVTGKVIAGRYLVILDGGGSPLDVANRAGVSPLRTYRSAVVGFTAQLTSSQLASVRRNPAVAFVEPDQVFTASATQTMDGNGDPWGLDRIDQRSRPLSRSYTYTRSGSGVRAYIIDTGILTGHSDFGGRAQNVYDAFGGNGQDCNGHGTHVAGTVGGATYGVAKSSLLRGVRVLNCSGSGSTSGIVAAVDWVRGNAIRPAVANLSLGGGYSSALNTAVSNLHNSGVFTAVAAGNESQNACNVSPASAATVYTTAASDRNDYRASFSNYGSCVDGYAPGVAIKSA
jgi:subtilisin family serine protease